MSVSAKLRIRNAAAMVAVIAMASGLAAAVAPRAAGAGAMVCKTCEESGNDTTFTPGRSATPREFEGWALHPAIGFVGADQLLHCALPAGAGWQVENVSAMPVGDGCSIVVDGAGMPWIAAHDANGVLFAFRRNAAGGWDPEPVDPSSIVTGAPSMAVVPNGVAIAFVDGGTGTLKYAERAGSGAWTAMPVTPDGGRPYRDPSLAVDGDVRAISFRDAGAGDLMLSEWLPGSNWSTTAVDTAGDVGGYSSLLGGPSHGGWGIAYYDYTNADLKYAESLATGWSIETVDGAGERVGRFCSAVSFSGSPHDLVGIAYYDQTHGDLKYAQKRGGAWTVTVQDTAGDVGTSIACGVSPSPTDSVGIVYVDRTAGDLLYQWHAGTVNAVAWPAGGVASLHLEWVRAASGAGGRLRFSVPRAGPVRVTLFDPTGRVIATPLRQSLPAGATEVRWDGRDGGGRRVRAGVFFARVETAGGTAAVPAVVLP